MSVENSFGNKNLEYYKILQFSKDHKDITYTKFNEYILNEINLFDVPSDEYFLKIEKILDKVIKILPAIKRIFSKPVIYLKDIQEIVPVEAVKVINNQTLSHASVHSELWDDITKEGLKPRKLMTIEKVENYVIYENIIFTRFIDSILGFIKKSIVLMKDILYGCQDIHFNLLDRTHHQQYFLAIGKLHIEYVHAHEKHFSTYAHCIEKLLFIERTIRSRLKSPVYIHCKKNKAKITLKKTNVFRSHKDYKQIYYLLKEFDKEIIEVDLNNFSDDVTRKEYNSYCNLLSIFALSHFNFIFEDNEIFDFENLQTSCSYIDWKIDVSNIKDENIEGIKFKFNKDKQYTICLLYGDKKEIDNKKYNFIKQTYCADEILFVNSQEYGIKENVYLSIYDIDSFRRLQQIFLRGMIYCDDKHDICPFCGNKTEFVDDKYECGVCRGEISELTCPETNEIYYVSTIKKYNTIYKKNIENEEKRRFLHDRYSEAQLHFRNITPIAVGGTIVCPKCGKKHN